MSYTYPDYGMASDSSIAASGNMAGGAGGAAAAGSGINWAGAGATAGASAIGGIIQAMYQAEQERKAKIERAQKQVSDTAGDYGKNQQTMMQQMMQNWQGALK
jgi:hypothetical protein